MTIRLHANRYWTDRDCVRFLANPKAMGWDPAQFDGQEVVIANGCQDGALLADVVEDLQRYGAKKVVLTTLKPEPRVLKSVKGQGL